MAGERRRIVILCGHYEGVDERVRLTLAPEEVSLGDYVLTGGELPALILIDAAARLVPGVLGDPSSVLEESFSDALLEYPQYTRPAEIGGIGVPMSCFRAIMRPFGCGVEKKRCAARMCDAPIF